MRAILAIFLLASLARCVAPEPEPQQVARPAPAPVAVATPPAPAPGVAVDWQDRPASPGDWAYRRDERGSVALFGPPGADADFLVRCAADGRRIYISRKGGFESGASGTMTLRASTGLAAYRIANTNGAPGYVAAELAATDRHLDALAFSRGRFLVSVQGADDLIIPAWPELGRVIEDCRG